MRHVSCPNLFLGTGKQPRALLTRQVCCGSAAVRIIPTSGSSIHGLFQADDTQRVHWACFSSGWSQPGQKVLMLTPSRTMVVLPGQGSLYRAVLHGPRMLPRRGGNVVLAISACFFEDTLAGRCGENPGFRGWIISRLKSARWPFGDLQQPTHYRGRQVVLFHGTATDLQTRTTCKRGPAVLPQDFLSIPCPWPFYLAIVSAALAAARGARPVLGCSE